MNRFLQLATVLARENVRYCLIGVWGANYHAQSGGTVFTTHDRDLFVPPDPENLVRAWQACEQVGLELTTGREPLDQPRDLWLAERIVERRALTRACDQEGIEVDLTLVMGEFEFESVWRARRTFVAEGASISVARLADIVTSKAQAGRPKDLLFLETHKQALRELLEREDPLREARLVGEFLRPGPATLGSSWRLSREERLPPDESQCYTEPVLHRRSSPLLRAGANPTWRI